MTGWEILQQIWRLQRAVSRDACPCLERHRLFRMAPFVLAMVKAHRTPSEVASALGVPPPTLSHVLKRLEEDGLVYRQTCPSDRRRFQFSLTPSGQRALQAAHDCIARAMETYIARLDEQERAELARLLGKMLGEEGAMGLNE